MQESGSLVAVFDGHLWPLRRWQLLVAADDYGVGPGMRARLSELPDVLYEDAAAVGRGLERAQVPRRVRARR